MKIVFVFLCLIGLAAGIARASAPVALTISNFQGSAIPDDFIGLSFETSVILPNPNHTPGAEPFYLFSPTNRTLIALFKTLGVKNLRVGGGTVDIPKRRVPAPADIDQLFAFARNADVKVIYSFRMLRGDPTNAAFLAKYIWQNHRAQLDCFAIGNEPDWRSYHRADAKIRDYPSYIADWRRFADAILAAAPEAKFAGPDTGSDWPVEKAGSTDYDGKSWTQLFADDEKNSGHIALVLQHDYVGQSARGVSVSAALNAMLSQRWDAVEYPALYRQVLAPVAADGLPFRMTECNDYTRGVDGASDAFASALWALDYMHWWAAHGCAGVNFHNNEWLYTDTILLDAAGNYRLNPKAYGIKAFDLGGHGRVAPVAISDPNHFNLTAYAVRNATNLFVTAINKEYDRGAHNANVTIAPGAEWKKAQVMFLTGWPGSKTGVRLGGAGIGDDGSWSGAWTALADKHAQCILKLHAATAAIVKFSAD